MQRQFYFLLSFCTLFAGLGVAQNVEEPVKDSLEAQAAGKQGSPAILKSLQSSQDLEVSVENIRKPALLRSLLEEKKWRAAETQIDDLLAKAPNDASLLFWAGYLRARQSHHIEAIPFLRRSEERSPKVIATRKVLAASYHAIHQYLLYERKMAQLINDSPQDADVHLSFAVHQILIRADLSDSTAHLIRALQIRPTDFRALHWLGFVAETTGDTTKARRYYERSVAELVEDKAARFSAPYLGMARLLISKEPHAALRYCLRAVEIEPLIAENHNITGRIYLQLLRPLEAIVEFDKARQLDPTAAEPRYSLYKLYQQLNRTSEASMLLAEFELIKRLYD